ncbi:MAG: hypothetical protein R3F28_06290 [Candidatus Kapaibacterium sp.]
MSRDPWKRAERIDLVLVVLAVFVGGLVIGLLIGLSIGGKL